MKLIGCDNSKVGAYAKLVKDRNDSAHPSGVIHFSQQRALDQKIAQTLRAVQDIEKHSECVIRECYRRFLENSFDPEDREYPDAADQIREVLVHANYFSQKDVEICRSYDLAPLEDHKHFGAIQSLHDELVKLYPNEDAGAG